jgi:hypothetical protein
MTAAEAKTLADKGMRAALTNLMATCESDSCDLLMHGLTNDETAAMWHALDTLRTEFAVRREALK